MLKTFFIADTRQNVMLDQCFEAEAAMFSFQRFLSMTIPKYVSICDSHSWISRPECLMVLSDYPEGPKTTVSKFLNTATATKQLVPTDFRHSGASITLAGETWSKYLLIAIQRISDILKGYTKSSSNDRTKERIVIYSTDLFLMGNSIGNRHTNEIFEKSVLAFCNAVTVLLTSSPDLLIEIVCVNVSELPSSLSFDDINANASLSLQVLLKRALGESVEFTVLRNSSMYFEEELRRLISAYIPTVSTKLEFPPVNGMQCSIQFDLSATTFTAADSISPEDWISSTMFSIASRSHIDPLFLEGGGLLVYPAKRTPNFKSDGSFKQNVLSFKSLSHLLASKDTVLILKLDSGLRCQQYWALIPPATDSDTESASLSFLCDGISRDLRIQSASHMVAIRLTDRDGVLVTSPLAEEEEDQLSAEEVNTDTITMQETEIYLEEALFGTMGITSQYNPLACPSGVLNMQMSKLLLNDDSSNKNFTRGQPLAATNQHMSWGQSAPSMHQQHQLRPQQYQQQQPQTQQHQTYSSGNYKTPQQAYGNPQHNMKQQTQPQFRQEGQKGYEEKKSNMGTGYPPTSHPQESTHLKKQQQESIQYQKKPLDIISNRNNIQTSTKAYSEGSRSHDKSVYGQTPHSAFGHVVGGTTNEKSSNPVNNVQPSTATSKRRKTVKKAQGNKKSLQTKGWTFGDDDDDGDDDNEGNPLESGLSTMQKDYQAKINDRGQQNNNSRDNKRSEKFVKFDEEDIEEDDDDEIFQL